jgi:hypothetical protein
MQPARAKFAANQMGMDVKDRHLGQRFFNSID